MPQMAPLSWLTLFIFFIITLILFSLMNYFLSPPITPSPQTDSFKFKSLNWKW